MMGSIIKLTRWSLQSEVHIYFFDTGCETFFGTKFFRDRFRDFFRYQIFSRPVPGLFSVPNFFETGSETFFGTKFFRDRFRYHQKNWRIPGNGNSRDRDVTLCLTPIFKALYHPPTTWVAYHEETTGARPHLQLSHPLLPPPTCSPFAPLENVHSDPLRDPHHAHLL